MCFQSGLLKMCVLSYILKRETSYKELEQPGTSWDYLERAGTIWKELEPPVMRSTQQRTDTKKQEIYRKKLYLQRH